MKEERLKIIGIQVDGLRKLTAVEMEFAEKGLIQFRGKNEQGKTTILDAFAILLKGNKCVETDMIQHGSKRAEIIGKIGEYVIKRVITEKSNRIEVTKEGKALGRPQEFLDTLINELTFNPRPFLNKSPEEKLRFMMDFLKIDFTAIDKKIKFNEDERLVVGRVVKRMGELKPVTKVEKVSISDLIQEKNDIQDSNQRLREGHRIDKEKLATEIREFNGVQASRQKEIDDETSTKDLLEQRMAEIQEQLGILEDDIEASSNRLIKLPKALPEKPFVVEIEVPVLADTLSIDSAINDAEETNLMADAYETYCTKKKEKDAEEAKYEDHTAKIEKFRNVKKMMLRNADIPIEGLEIREDGVYHNGDYSENWSEAQGLKISAELCLAMQPTLKALFVDKGENYDPDGLKALEKWAIENDLQCFITVVTGDEGESADGVFYIEEGRII